MIRFFTNFDGVEYQLRYVVVNPFNFPAFMSWVRRFPNVREILLDTGVETFFLRQNLPDYPRWFLKQYIRLIEILNDFYARRYKVIVTVPDIPCDYPGRGYLYPWNVKRTIEYIQYFLDNIIPKYDKITFMAVVQGKKDSIPSVLKTYMEHQDVYREFSLIALGPTCSTRAWKTLAELILRFDAITRHRYHVFGPTKRTIKLVAGRVRYMYSFDSTGYFHNGKLRAHRRERTRAFLEWIKDLPPEVEY